jgi:hypothetical protein
MTQMWKRSSTFGGAGKAVQQRVKLVLLHFPDLLQGLSAIVAQTTLQVRP